MAILDNPLDASAMHDGDVQTAIVVPDVSTIDIQFTQEKLLRSVAIYPWEHPFKCKLRLSKINDLSGQSIEISTFEVDRRNYDLNVGFRPHAPVVIGFPETRGNHFHIEILESEGLVSIGEIELSEAFRLSYFQEKQLAKMFPLPHPDGEAYLWGTTFEPITPEVIIDPLSVVDLTGLLDDQGMLNWDAPEGSWIVIHFGMALTEVMNRPASDEGRGLEVDKFKKEAVARHFEAYIGEYLNRLNESANDAVTHIVVDSYEVGSANWSEEFTSAFNTHFGYDVLPFLPVFTGRPVGSADESERFLWDLRRLIADLLATEYVGELKRLCEEKGKVLWLENFGHWGFPGEFLNYGGQTQEIAGEFWVEPPLGNIELRAAASAAHIYGINTVFAEAFTTGILYRNNPASMKVRGDWAVTEGINHFVYNAFLHQPDDRIPGYGPAWGTEFNRHSTWFNVLDRWGMYWRRIHYLMKQGTYVADVAYFIGEDTPMMIGVTDPEIPSGYAYDFINSDVLINHSQVENGRIVLDSGMSYSLLVLPNRFTMRPAVLEKIDELVRGGVAILGNRPKRSPSKQDYPNADNEVVSLSEGLWGDIAVESKQVGDGWVLKNMNLRETLEFLEIEPDLQYDADSISWIHRSSSEFEIYFISNQLDEKRSIDFSFRSEQGHPQLWDATTGEFVDVLNYRFRNGRIDLSLELFEEESIFVVIDKNEEVQSSSNEPTQVTGTIQLVDLNGSWNVRFESNVDESFIRTLDALIDWKDSNESVIQGFSGTATYSLDFNLEAFNDMYRYFLDLGEIFDIAEVDLNGQAVGLVWNAPWRIEVTDQLITGSNSLEIKVTNTWLNRLISDSALSDEERKTWIAHHAFISELTPRRRGGLLGPVRLSYYPTGDTDNDGVSDYREWIFGSDTQNSADFFNLDMSLASSEGSEYILTFSIPGKQNRRYQIQKTLIPSQVNHDWSEVYTSDIRRQDGVFTTELVGSLEELQGFYRLKVIQGG